MELTHCRCHRKPVRGRRHLSRRANELDTLLDVWQRKHREASYLVFQVSNPRC